MEEIAISQIFFILFVILISSYTFSRIFSKYKISGNLAPLLIGILFGLPLLHYKFPANFMDLLGFFSELAIIFLLFLAGLDTDIKGLLKLSKFGIILALSSILFPVLLGFVFSFLFGFGFLVGLVVGLSLAVTAEGLLVELLEENSMLDSTLGKLMLEIAIVDDIIEMLLLLIVSSLSIPGAKLNISTTLSQILVFALFVLMLRFLMHTIVSKLLKHPAKPYETTMLAFSLVFFLAALSSFSKLGIAIGALIGGVIIKHTFETIGKVGIEEERELEEVIRDLSFGLFAPIFFFYIGYSMALGGVNIIDLKITVVIVILAFLGKIIGSIIPYILTKKDIKEGFVVGMGLNSRGAMELVAATIAFNYGLINGTIYSALVIMSMVTTVASVLFFGRFIKR